MWCIELFLRFYVTLLLINFMLDGKLCCRGYVDLEVCLWLVMFVKRSCVVAYIVNWFFMEAKAWRSFLLEYVYLCFHCVVAYIVDWLVKEENLWRSFLLELAYLCCYHLLWSNGLCCDVAYVVMILYSVVKMGMINIVEYVMDWCIVLFEWFCENFCRDKCWRGVAEMLGNDTARQICYAKGDGKGVAR